MSTKHPRKYEQNTNLSQFEKKSNNQSITHTSTLGAKVCETHKIVIRCAILVRMSPYCSEVPSKKWWWWEVEEKWIKGEWIKLSKLSPCHVGMQSKPKNKTSKK